MRRFGKHFVSGKALATIVLSIAVFTFSSGQLLAQTFGQDFFTNTQQGQVRTDGTDGLAGFNPCGLGGTVATDGLSCSAGTGGLLSVGANGGKGPIGSSFTASDPILSTSDNVTLFIFLGPGAVTDNMFSVVEHPPSPGTCGAQGGGGSDVGTGKLNCGDVHFDLVTQGQTVSTLGNILNSALTASMPMDLPFSGTDPSVSHRSQIENAFVWNPTSSAVTIPINTANMPTIAGVSPAQQKCSAKTGTTDASVCSQQSMIDTTALSATANSSVSQTTSFATGQEGGVLTAAMSSNPIVSWATSIKQDDVAGTGGSFEQDISGSFTYNQLPPGASASLLNVFSEFQALAPTGKSFTNRSTTPFIP